MRKEIKVNRELKLFYKKFYPFNGKNSKKRYLVTLGLGCNIGDCFKRFEKLFFYFKKHNFVDIIKTAPILKNPPFGFKEQNDFYNTIMLLKTDLPPIEFLKFLLKVEKRFGRKRVFKNAPRTLDLDIIFFDKIKYKTKNLKIPHPEFKKRVSVTLPLALL